jgi:hypothetical protein
VSDTNDTGLYPVDSTGITMGAGIPDADLAPMFAAIEAGRIADGAK